MVKISFLGDIMCEKPFLKAARKKSGYVFDDFLSPCRDFFQSSDYIIGNLETPCDPESKPTQDMFVFNAPEEFVRALKNAGIDFLTTATNHCLDRGESGLVNTIKVLDRTGIGHTGTFTNPSERGFDVIQLEDGTQIAVFSFTYGTNYMDNHVLIPDDKFYMVNYLTPLYSGRNKAYDEMNYSLRARATRLLPRGLRIKINSLLGRSSNLAFVDKLQKDDISAGRQEEIRKMISEAQKEADLVVVCPHFGGQFNTEHGTYVSAFTEFFEECGVDLMIGNHPHVSQKVEKTDNAMWAAYSLGNVSMSLSTPYVIKDDLPDYSIMLHVYLKEKRISHLSFSILVEREQKGFIKAYPVKKLYECSNAAEKKQIKENCRIIFNRVLNKNNTKVDIQDEYLIEV